MDIISSQGMIKKNLATAPAPHMHSPLSTTMIMAITLISLMPAFIVMITFFGTGVVWQFFISASTAFICQLICGFLRHRSLYKSVGDLSYLITALLLALTIPPLLPAYFTILATVFAIIVVKECFGGLGMNIFNPAMAGFVFLLISAPSQMFDTFIAPASHAYEVASLERTYNVIFSNEDPALLHKEVMELNNENDALSGATWLETMKTAKKSGNISDVREANYKDGAESAYLYLAIAYALGGCVLIAFRIIFLRMVISFFLSFSIFVLIGKHFFPSLVLNLDTQLILGGAMLGAFFIITDPVTNAGTAKGRIVFAILTAFLIVIIRAFGSYSDAVAFAVLLSNSAAPLIDVLTHRRPYGVGFAKKELLKPRPEPNINDVLDVNDKSKINNGDKA